MSEETQEKTITITESHLKAMMSEVAEEAIRNRGVQKLAKRVDSWVGTVRFYKDKLVVWYGNVRRSDDKDAEGRFVWLMDIKLDQKEGLTTVKHLDFLNQVGEYANNNHKVKILKRNVEEVIEDTEELRTENPDERNNKNFVPRVIEAEVVAKKVTSEIEVISGPYAGQKFTVVDNDVLNK